MPDEERLTEVSPTLFGAICRCGLAVQLSRTRRRAPGVWPSSPQARLGTAVHSVLAWVSNGGLAEILPSELEAVVRRRWCDEVAAGERAAARFPAEAYFGPARRWPGFATIEERLVIEAEWLAAEVADAASVERWVERPLSSAVPPMRGSPDLVVCRDGGAQIVEFKSGRVEPEDALPSGRYGQQVLMYASMVRDLGVHVAAGEIRPIGRARVAVEITDEAIDQTCVTVGSVVAEFNSAIDADDAARLARPGERSCGFCPHTLRCPALWSDVGLTELGEFEVVQGTVRHVQSARVGSVAVELTATAGTRHGTVTMTGLDPRRLPTVAELGPGDEVRVSGLRSGPREGSALSTRPGSWIQIQRMESAERMDG
jgi:hypothetical protein